MKKRKILMGINMGNWIYPLVPPVQLFKSKSEKCIVFGAVSSIFNNIITKIMVLDSL